MGTVKIKAYVLVVNFWIKAVTMTTSHLMTGRYIPHFGLSSFSKIFHTLPHHGNDFA